MTEPLTPIDCDLTDFPFMPLEVQRLRRSKAWLICKRNPALAFYMINLWTACWHDKPAGSLEDDDDVLADRAMCDPAKWPKIKADVLRGWVKCDDGRLYHPVVAEKVKDAWDSKLDQRWRTERSRIKKHNDRHHTKVPLPTFEEWIEAGCPQGQRLPVPKDTTGQTDDIGSKGKGEGQEEGEGMLYYYSDPNGAPAAGASAAVDKSTENRKQAWRTCGRWLVANGIAESTAREYMGLILKDFPLVAIDAFEAAPKLETTPDPRAYLKSTAQRLAGDRKGVTVPSAEAEKTAAYLAAQAAERAAIAGAKVPDSVREARARMGPVHAPAPPADDERAAA
jgi:hypothetical protein